MWKLNSQSDMMHRHEADRVSGLPRNVNTRVSAGHVVSTDDGLLWCGERLVGHWDERVATPAPLSDHLIEMRTTLERMGGCSTPGCDEHDAPMAILPAALIQQLEYLYAELERPDSRVRELVVDIMRLLAPHV